MSNIGSDGEFNEKVHQAIDEALSEMLGQTVLHALYTHLRNQYDISRDELPYRLETLYQVLGNIFGVVGAKTIGNDVARKLYHMLDLNFTQTSNFTLKDYIDQAKRMLSQRK